MAGSDQSGRVAEVVAGLLQPLGLVLEDVSVTPAGKRRLVRITVDRDTGRLPAEDHDSVVPPLSLDEIADATSVISSALDATEPLGNAPYVLEVSSPGVQRPLTQARHYRRNVGRLLTLTLTDSTVLTGRLLAAGPEELRVQLADDVRRVVALTEVSRGRVQVEFAPPGSEVDVDPGEYADADEGIDGDVVAAGADDAREDEKI